MLEATTRGCRLGSGGCGRPAPVPPVTARADLEYPNATRPAVLAVAEIAGVSSVEDGRTVDDGKDGSVETRDGAAWWDTLVRCTAQEVVERVNAEARALGLVDGDGEFTTAAKIGGILKTLRITVRRVGGKQRTREREITRRDASWLLHAYAPATSGTTRVSDAPSEPPVNQPSFRPPVGRRRTPGTTRQQTRRSRPRGRRRCRSRACRCG